MLREAGVRVPAAVSAPGSHRDDIHLIFEYGPGLVPLAGGTIPRNNRFIASPKKTAANTLLPAETLRSLIPEISGCTRAFLSGYQYLRSEEEFIRAAEQIRTLKSCNPRMRVHIECVSVTDGEVLAGLMRHILPAADSAGMNEHELGLLLGREGQASPEGLASGVLELARKTGLARVHLHTFGYYLLTLRNGQGNPKASCNALLYAARVVADAAGGTGRSISPAGIIAVTRIGRAPGDGTGPGASALGDYQVLAVPTLIASGITKTTGLGDIISSAAFVADPF
jgi:ADP-dependent phosphofructokinase/glucokinase